MFGTTRRTTFVLVSTTLAGQFGRTLPQSRGCCGCLNQHQPLTPIARAWGGDEDTWMDGRKRLLRSSKTASEFSETLCPFEAQNNVVSDWVGRVLGPMSSVVCAEHVLPVLWSMVIVLVARCVVLILKC